MDDEKQEASAQKYPERLTIMLTREEKQAVRVLAALTGTSESDLLRNRPLPEILIEYGRIREAAAA